MAPPRAGLFIDCAVRQAKNPTHQLRTNFRPRDAVRALMQIHNI